MEIVGDRVEPASPKPQRSAQLVANEWPLRTKSGQSNKPSLRTRPLHVSKSTLRRCILTCAGGCFLQQCCNLKHETVAGGLWINPLERFLPNLMRGVYSYEEFLGAVAHQAGLVPRLIPIPFAVWHALARVSEIFPSPLLTRNQVELMQIDTPAESAGVDSFRTKLGVHVLVAAANGTIGALISGRFAPGKQIAVDCFQMGAHRNRCCLGVAPQQSGDQRTVLLAVCVSAFGAE
jgi:hypothetical protein